MRDSSAVICALCRDVAYCLPETAARMERLATMFGNCRIVVYENDSSDQTLTLLRQWSAMNPQVHLISERLREPRFAQETATRRMIRMAYYRNQCREAALAQFPSADFVLVADTDLEGGWSYDGVADTFASTDWDFVGSNGIAFAAGDPPQSVQAIHRDAFAFRRPGCEGREDPSSVSRLEFRRGDPWLPVWSCFGGLGVYRMECFRQAQYYADDCEHVTLHRALRLRGYDRLFLNPNQIVLYTPLPTGS
jgi:hypothetical protein